MKSAARLWQWLLQIRASCERAMELWCEESSAGKGWMDVVSGGTFQPFSAQTRKISGSCTSLKKIFFAIFWLYPLESLESFTCLLGHGFFTSVSFMASEVWGPWWIHWRLPAEETPSNCWWVARHVQWLSQYALSTCCGRLCAVVVDAVYLQVQLYRLRESSFPTFFILKNIASKYLRVPQPFARGLDSSIAPWSSSFLPWALAKLSCPAARGCSFSCEILQDSNIWAFKIEASTPAAWSKMTLSLILGWKSPTFTNQILLKVSVL